VRAFRRGEEVRGGDYVGVAALSAAFVASLPLRGCLVGDALIPLLERGRSVATSDLAGPWHDIGTPREYLAANLRWLADEARSSFVDAGAEVAEGISLERSIIGRGARVTGRGILRDVVVWPGARARAPLERAIVTTRASLSGRLIGRINAA
jgi:NDP-sugar pyrophosphorylase family protein